MRKKVIVTVEKWNNCNCNRLHLKVIAPRPDIFKLQLHVTRILYSAKSICTTRILSHLCHKWLMTQKYIITTLI